MISHAFFDSAWNIATTTARVIVIAAAIAGVLAIYEVRYILSIPEVQSALEQYEARCPIEYRFDARGNRIPSVSPVGC